jgi:hypothetical protein
MQDSNWVYAKVLPPKQLKKRAKMEISIHFPGYPTAYRQTDTTDQNTSHASPTVPSPITGSDHDGATLASGAAGDQRA